LELELALVPVLVPVLELVLVPGLELHRQPNL